MKKILYQCTPLVVMAVGMYVGMLAAAFSLGYTSGGYWFPFSFGLFVFTVPAILGAVFSAGILYFTGRTQQWEYAKQGGGFFSAALAGYLTLELLWMLPEHRYPGDLFFTLAVLMLSLSLFFLLILVVYHRTTTARISSIKVTASFLLMVAVYVGIQYHRSLPHLSDACFAISIGETRSGVVEKLTPFVDREAYNAIALRESDDHIGIRDGGLFCSVSFEQDVVVKRYISSDGL